MTDSSASTVCPKCERLLPPDAPRGLCANCLIATVLGSGPISADPESMPREFGGYRLLEEVARGGMGIVYRARQHQVHRTVALKVMVAGAFAAPDSVERFLAEAEAAASLDHPNIVPLYEVGECEGRPFFSMKLIDGPSLAHHLDHGEMPMPPREAAELLGKLARAVHYAHQRGILHRDIKPGNVILDSHGEPHLTDFGLAKLMEQESALTRTLAMMGTPSYMSPEQARGQAKALTTAMDVYGLGAILYELLTGRPPFRGGTTMETIRHVLEKEPRRPSLSNPAVDRDLDIICLKCLEKDPARRYGSAGGLAADLDRWRRREPISARPSTALERVTKWTRRNPGAFAALSAILLLLTGGVSVSTWLALRESKARKNEFHQRIFAQAAQAEALAMQRKAEAATRQADANLRRAEWLVYAGNLTLAQNDFEFGNGGLAGRHLSNCRNELRGWEYDYLSSRIGPQRTLQGHRGTVSGVAFSPDGQRLVTGSEDGTAKVWETASGRELYSLTARQGMILCVAFSPDGQRIVTGTGDWASGQHPGEAIVWNAANGQKLFDLKGHNYYLWSVAFSSDGRRLLTGAGDRNHTAGEAKVWDAVSGQEILSLAGCTESLRAAVFSPDGRRIVTASVAGTSKMWDAATGQPLFPLSGHQAPITCVAFSVDGQRFVTGSWDRTAIVWETATGRPLFTRKGHAEAVWCVAFSPDGQRFVTGSMDQTVKVWNSRQEEAAFTIKGHAGMVRSVAFSADGSRILTGSEDGTAKIWDAQRGQAIPVLRGHLDFVSSIAFSPDNHRCVTGSGDGLAKIWDLATGAELVSLNGSTALRWNEAAVWSVGFSPDGQRVVTGSQDRSAKVWDALTGRELLVLRHTGVVSSVEFSADGKWIATGVGECAGLVTHPGEASVWDAATGRKVLALPHASGVLDVSFSPDGQRLLAATGDGTALVFETATGRALLSLRHPDALWSAAFSPDGRRLVTGSWDQSAKVWDAASGQEIFTLKGHTGRVRGVVFSPDGQRIVTSSDDRTVKLWNASTGQEALTLPKHTEMVWSVAFSSNGLVLGTGIAGANATASLWSATTWPPKSTAEPE